MFSKSRLSGGFGAKPTISGTGFKRAKFQRTLQRKFRSFKKTHDELKRLDQDGRSDHKTTRGDIISQNEDLLEQNVLKVSQNLDALDRSLSANSVQKPGLRFSKPKLASQADLIARSSLKSIPQTRAKFDDGTAKNQVNLVRTSFQSAVARNQNLFGF